MVLEKNNFETKIFCEKGLKKSASLHTHLSRAWNPLWFWERDEGGGGGVLLV